MKILYFIEDTLYFFHIKQNVRTALVKLQHITSI